MIGLDIIYPIASKVAYEIVINFHYLDTPILTAKGTLSIDCVTENCNIGYPIKYCPVCGAKLE